MKKKMSSNFEENLAELNYSFPKVDVVEYLTEKGLKFEIVNNGKWIKMKCPFHKDKHPSFFLHIEHGGWNCYSNCGTGNWNEFCENMGWDDFDKDDGVIVDNIPNVIWDGINEYNDELIKPKNKKEVFLPPKDYKRLRKKLNNKIIKYLRNRKLLGLFNYYDFYYSENKDKDYGWSYVNRFMIPVHNSEGKYSWMEGRSIKKKDKYKYYRPEGVIKTKHLFNYHRIINKFDYAIVAEGIIDAMLIYSWGLPGTCCWGTVLSEDQISLLMNFDEVIICFDNDNAGIKGAVGDKNKKNSFGAIDMLRGTGCTVTRIIMPRNRDANDIGKYEFIKRYKKRKLYI